VNKEVLLKEDLPREISWANSNGQGMIPGTNENNFAVFRGGYNCRHTAIPFKMTKRERAEYEKKEVEDEEESEEVIDQQIEEIKKNVKKAEPKSKSSVKFDEKLYLTTIEGPIVDEAEAVFEKANNLIKDIVNIKRMNVTLRRAGEATKPGTRKFVQKMNAEKGTDLASYNVGTISSRAGGNCANNNTFLNIKVKKDDVCDFVPIDMDSTQKTVDKYIKEFDLKEIKQRGDVYLYDPKTRAPLFVQSKNFKTGETRWKWWTVGDKASLRLKGRAENIAPTVTHESGHAIQNNYDPNKVTFNDMFRNFKLNLKLDAPTKYGESCTAEFWAESFTSFVYDNKGLKKRQPNVFNFVESYLDRLGILKSIKIAK